MAKSENTTTEAHPNVGALIEELRAAGVDLDLSMRVWDCIQTERGEAIAQAARLYYNFPGDKNPMTPGDFSDRFHDLSRRLWGIEAAVCYIASDCLDKCAQTGVRQLVEDAARELDRLTEAFDAENWLRRKQEAQHD